MNQPHPAPPNPTPGQRLAPPVGVPLFPSTATATATATAPAPGSAGIRRHPIRGALWGLVLGLGLASLLIGRRIIAFGTLTPVLVVLAGVVLGVLAGTVLPPKGGRAPRLAAPAPATAPPAAPRAMPPPPGGAV